MGSLPCFAKGFSLTAQLEGFYHFVVVLVKSRGEGEVLLVCQCLGGHCAVALAQAVSTISALSVPRGWTMLFIRWGHSYTMWLPVCGLELMKIYQTWELSAHPHLHSGRLLKFVFHRNSWGLIWSLLSIEWALLAWKVTVVVFLWGQTSRIECVPSSIPFYSASSGWSCGGPTQGSKTEASCPCASFSPMGQDGNLGLGSVPQWGSSASPRGAWGREHGVQRCWKSEIVVPWLHATNIFKEKKIFGASLFTYCLKKHLFWMYMSWNYGYIFTFNDPIAGFEAINPSVSFIWYELVNLTFVMVYSSFYGNLWE